jgi:hypothetical protein
MGKEYWVKSGIEPGLWETLADPIVISLMNADRITRKDVLTASTCRGGAVKASAVSEHPRRSRVSATA